MEASYRGTVNCPILKIRVKLWIFCYHMGLFLTLFSDSFSFWVQKTHFRAGKHADRQIMKNVISTLVFEFFANSNSVVRYFKSKNPKMDSP
jgi:hypothetical protein